MKPFKKGQKIRVTYLINFMGKNVGKKFDANIQKVGANWIKVLIFSKDNIVSKIPETISQNKEGDLFIKPSPYYKVRVRVEHI